VTQAVSKQVKTITEMLQEAPDVDVRASWESLWGILTEIKERIVAEFPVEQHPSSTPYEYYEAGGFEGSLSTYTGPQVEWFVHSWIGNRAASILDMNITVWLGPHIDAPHLCLVFGTVPHLFHYSDFIARRDIGVDYDYVQRYYEPENADYLAFRGDERFTWNVSHGSYMRAIISPVAHSYMAERTPENIEVLRGYVMKRFERWLDYVRTAPAVPEEERAALQARDHKLREQCYTLDPMNVLGERAMGVETARKMVALRAGLEQMAGN
jgi:hypothetical protein